MCKKNIYKSIKWSICFSCPCVLWWFGVIVRCASVKDEYIIKKTVKSNIARMVLWADLSVGHWSGTRQSWLKCVMLRKKVHVLADPFSSPSFLSAFQKLRKVDQESKEATRQQVCDLVLCFWILTQCGAVAKRCGCRTLKAEYFITWRIRCHNAFLLFEWIYGAAGCTILGHKLQYHHWHAKEPCYRGAGRGRGRK